MRIAVTKWSGSRRSEEEAEREVNLGRYPIDAKFSQKRLTTLRTSHVSIATPKSVCYSTNTITTNTVYKPISAN